MFSFLIPQVVSLMSRDVFIFYIVCVSEHRQDSVFTLMFAWAIILRHFFLSVPVDYLYKSNEASTLQFYQLQLLAPGESFIFEQIYLFNLCESEDTVELLKHISVTILYEWLFIVDFSQQSVFIQLWNKVLDINRACLRLHVPPSGIHGGQMEGIDHEHDQRKE